MDWPTFSFFDSIVQDFGFGLIEVVAPILAFFAALYIAVFAVQRLRAGLASPVVYETESSFRWWEDRPGDAQESFDAVNDYYDGQAEYQRAFEGYEDLN